MALSRLVAFAQVVDAESFTGAAAAWGVRKSTVSRTVTALENAHRGPGLAGGAG
jgi:DNA-binding transcriptional LysR family regulator